MRITSVAGILAIILGLAILTLAEGPRRYYSGGFFVALGLVILWRARSRDGAKGAG